MKRFSFVVCCTLTAAAFGLSACENLKSSSPAPDLSAKVVTSKQKGLVAVPPDCPSWHDAENGVWDNTMLPQLGCANARNLAVMIENPADLVEGHPAGPSNGVVSAASVHNYVSGKTKPLIDPNKKEPTVYNFNATNPGSGSNN